MKNFFQPDKKLSTVFISDNRPKYMEDWPIRKLSDVHYAQAVFLEDLKMLCGDKCINVGLDQTNDSAWRACLI